MKFSQKTVATYIVGIPYEHEIKAMPDTMNNFIVRKMLEGYKCLNPSKDTRVPITMSRKLFSNFVYTCANAYKLALFRDAMRHILVF